MKLTIYSNNCSVLPTARRRRTDAKGCNTIK
jgi:hypothetical protein